MADSITSRSQETVERVLSQIPDGTAVALRNVGGHGSPTFKDLLAKGKPMSKKFLQNLRDDGVDFSGVESLEHIIAGTGVDPTNEDKLFADKIAGRVESTGQADKALSKPQGKGKGPASLVPRALVPPIIPERISSQKRQASSQLPVNLASTASVADLKAEMEDISRRVKRKLKNDLPSKASISKASFDVQAEIGDLNIENNRLKAQMSFQTLRDSGSLASIEEYQSTPEFQKLQREAIKHADLADLAEIHGRHIDTDFGSAASFKRDWVTKFLISHQKWSADKKEISFGMRDHDATEKSREELVVLYASKNPQNRSEYCAITGRWYPNKCTAAHIVPSSYGHETMKVLFGDEVEDELHSPRNMMLMVAPMEETFDSFHWGFVPDVADCKSEEQMQKWHASEPKEYRIHIFDPNDSKTVWFSAEEGDVLLTSLHGRKIKFLNDFRPRARYLYLHYCVAQLNRHHKGKPDVMKVAATMDDVYWGTVAPFLKRTVLVGLTETLHHKYRHLFPVDPADFYNVDFAEALPAGAVAAHVLYDHSAYRRDRLEQSSVEDFEKPSDFKELEENGPQIPRGGIASSSTSQGQVGNPIPTPTEGSAGLSAAMQSLGSVLANDRAKVLAKQAKAAAEWESKDSRWKKAFQTGRGRSFSG